MLVGDSSALRVLDPQGLKKNTTQMTNSQQGVFNPITAGLQRQRLRHVGITQGRHIRSPVKLKKKQPQNLHLSLEKNGFLKTTD